MKDFYETELLTTGIQEDKTLNIQTLLKTIDGLQYDKVRDEFIHNGIPYKVRDIKVVDNKSNNYYFVRIGSPTEIIVLKCSSITGVPFYDEFNDKKIDQQIRKQEYWNNYYMRVTKQKRAEERKKRPKVARKPRPKKEKPVKEPLPKIACAECGTMFPPKKKSDKFCCTACRRRYYSRQQYLKQVGQTVTKKKCPVCKKSFEGDKRRTYCSETCRLKAKSTRELARQKEIAKAKKTNKVK